MADNLLMSGLWAYYSAGLSIRQKSFWQTGILGQIDNPPGRSEHEICKPEQKERMGRVKEIEKIFEPWPLLIVVAKHQRKRRRHQPLSAGSAFRRELPDAEDQIDDSKKLFFLPQEVHEYAQCDEREAVFVHIQVGNDARYQISAQMSGKGQNIIEKLNPEKAAEKEESLPAVFLRASRPGRGRNLPVRNIRWC